MHLLFVVGTRPEAIKMAPLILEARGRSGVRSTVVSTGQHREMLRPVLRLFGIVPDVDLDLMKPSQSLEELTARALVALGGVLRDRTPDAVVVQGDTTTAMTGALAAFYAKIPVAHVEAGLRTGDIHSPFPEEVNRRIVSQMTRWHLAPTRGSKENLLRESLPPSSMTDGRIVVTGNTVIDALHLAVEKVKTAPSTSRDVEAARVWKSAGANRTVMLVTGHRRENFGAPFEQFCLGLLDIAAAHPETLLVYPVHLNPHVQEPVKRLLGAQANIRLAPVADYPDFVELMTHADVIVTDSGGVQEEAPSLGIPVLVTRTTTERPEAVAAGGVLLVGPERTRLYAEAHRLLSDARARAAMGRRQNSYGDGRAAGRCIDAILGLDVAEFAPE